MDQEKGTPDYNEQPELDRTQPSPSRPPRRLDWRPSEYQSGGEESQQQTPPVRRVQRPGRQRRRPPTEGAPAWVVGLGVGALLAVIILLIVAFVFSRRSAAPEPTSTANVVTPTATLAPRPTNTPVVAETVTAGAEATEEVPATAPPSNVVAVGGYVRVAAQAGLSLRQQPSTTGPLVIVLDAGATLEVIGGPRDADGYVWWQLRMADGREGWSAAGAGEDVFLEPAPAP
jgi:hypothetical protein